MCRFPIAWYWFAVVKEFNPFLTRDSCLGIGFITKFFINLISIILITFRWGNAKCDFLSVANKVYSTLNYTEKKHTFLLPTLCVNFGIS